MAYLFTAQHDTQDVSLHNADEVGIRALGQRLVLVGIAACIVDPAKESALQSHQCDRGATGSSADQLAAFSTAVPIEASMHWHQYLKFIHLRPAALCTHHKSMDPSVSRA